MLLAPPRDNKSSNKDFRLREHADIYFRVTVTTLMTQVDNSRTIDKRFDTVVRSSDCRKHFTA